jgi:hypothetical protein
MVSWYLLLNALADEFNTKLYVNKVLLSKISMENKVHV